jgi:hypothetical protein
MFRTIRENNTSLPVPAAVAAPVARLWDWLGSATPLRGPLMFSSDYIAEMKVGGLRREGRVAAGQQGAHWVRCFRCATSRLQLDFVSLFTGRLCAAQWRAGL